MVQPAATPRGASRHVCSRIRRQLRPDAQVVAEFTVVGTIPVAVPGFARSRRIVVTAVVEVTGSSPVAAPAIGVAVTGVVVVGSAGVVAGAVVVGSVLAGSVPIGSVLVGTVDVTGGVVGSVVVVVAVVVGSVTAGADVVALVAVAGTPVLDARLVTPEALGLAAELWVAAVVVDFAASAVLVVAFVAGVRDVLVTPAAVAALVETGSGVRTVAFVGALGAPEARAALPLDTAARAIA